MKKVGIFVGILTFALVLSACNGDQTEQGSEESREGSEVEQGVNESIEKNYEDVPDPVANVNGEDIQKEDYIMTIESIIAREGIDIESEEAAQFLPMIKQQAVQSLVNERLILRAAEDDGIEALEAEVQERLEPYLAQYEDEEALEETLNESGLTMDELLEELENIVKQEKYLDQRIEPVEVSEEEIQSAYEELQALYDEELPSFEDYRDELELNLQMEKEQEQITEIIEQLRAESEISIFIE